MEQNISLNEICDKITKLEEKNKHLEEEIEKLKKENEKLKAQQSSAGPITKGDKILFDVISEIFYVSK